VSLDQFCVASQAQTSLKGSSEAKFSCIWWWCI